MKSYWVNKCLEGYSFGLAALIGALRFKKILKAYRPFVYLMIFYFVNEFIGQWCEKVYKTNSMDADIVYLVDFWMVLWLFKNWNSSNRPVSFYKNLALYLPLLWILDNLVLHTLFTFNPIFKIVYCLIAIFLSVDVINEIIISERRNILKNARFLICCAFVFFYSSQILFETLFIIDLKMSLPFYLHFLRLWALFNCLVNLTYALAALWIPTKQRFLLLYQ